MKCTFTVGQKVVCIRDEWEQPEYEEKQPIAGKTYTIRALIAYNDEVFLKFEEIVNPVFAWESGDHDEAAFEAVHFRPLQELKKPAFDFEALVTPTALDLVREKEPV
jgi:hypothetical protein